MIDFTYKITFIFLLFFPLFFFKSPFLKVIIFIYAYPILIMSGYAYGEAPSRVILNIGDSYYSNYYKISFYYSLLSYYIFIIFLFPSRHIQYNPNILPLQNSIRAFIFIALLITLPIAYPNAFFIGESRFGNMGSLTIFFIGLIFLSSKEKLDIILYMTILIIIYVILRGERVDFILSCLALYFLRSRKNISLIKLILPFSLLLILGIYSVIKRAGINVGFTEFFIIIIDNIKNFGTAVDVVHMYLSSIWYIEKIGYNLEPLLNLIFSFIPYSAIGGANSDYNFVSILREYIPNLGGGLFYIPFVMSFGLIGMILSGLLYSRLTIYLMKMKGYSSILFICFFIMQFRLQWYGFNYYGNIAILSILFYFILLSLKKLNLIRRNNDNE